MWTSPLLIVACLVAVIQGDVVVDRYRRLGGDSSHYCCQVDMPMTFLTRSRTKVEYKQVRSVVKTGSEPCGFHQVCATYEQIYRKEPTYVAEYYHVPKQEPCPNNKISCCPGYVMRAGHCLSGDDLIKESQTINDLKRLGLGPFVGQPKDENANQGTAAPKKTTTKAPDKQTTKKPVRVTTEGPTVPITDAPTTVVTKAPTTEVTEAPKVTTEIVTETEIPTTARAEKVTEAVTETATEAHTKAPTTKAPEPETDAPTEKTGDTNEEMSANDADELLALLRKLELIEKATEEPVVQPSKVPKTYETENEKVTTAEPQKPKVTETVEDEITITEEGEDGKIELDEEMLLKILEGLEAKERAAQI